MRTISVALAASLLVLVAVAVPGAIAATVVVSPADATEPAPTATSPKVVIIVGATEGTTSTYRSYADVEYATALKYTPNVVRIYSPNATWAAVQAAVAGANVVIYHGHGNGWPSPYTYDPAFKTKDGFGLNKTAGAGDSNRVYYGEPDIRTLDLAPGALVLLHNLCYASGNSEPGDAQPSLSVAEQRADNYASAFLAAGAAAVIADGHSGASSYLDALFTQHESLYDVWRGVPSFHDHSILYGSSRTPSAAAILDPEKTNANYYRSIVGNLAQTTDDVLAARMTSATTGSVSRLAGTDRYATAAAISAATFDPGVPVAYIATGGNFPDALAGAPIAGQTGAPILLVAPDSIPAATATELTRLKPAKIVILGSTGVVSAGVASDLAAFTTGSVSRLAGTDRYATAAAISAATFDPGVPVAYIATGGNFPDALAGAPLAGQTGAPILLVAPDSIPAATATELTRLKPAKIVILGSTGVVSAGVASDLAAFTTGSVSRLAGTDRYATAAAISAATVDPGVPVAYIATGGNFPDALAGAPLAGQTGAPILLVAPDSIPAATATELTRLKPAKIVILGSTGVVSAGVAFLLSTYGG